MVLFIKHIDIEGPDTLDVYFKKKGFQTQTIELQRGDCLPDDLSRVDAVISLGGPMNVYEEEKYPFLKSEDKFIKRVVSEEIPFIGICLGSQLLAKACGAKIRKSPEKEIGFLPVRVKKDPLFEGLDKELDVLTAVVGARKLIDIGLYDHAVRQLKVEIGRASCRERV